MAMNPLIEHGISLPDHRTLALWTVLAAQLMLQMDFLIVVVALPSIARDLDFSPVTLSWVPNAFGLAFGGLLLFVGRLGDIMGQVRAFRIGLFVFVLASLLGGVAQPRFLCDAAHLALLQLANRKPRVLELCLREPRKKVGLILARVERA